MDKTSNKIIIMKPVFLFIYLASIVFSKTQLFYQSFFQKENLTYSQFFNNTMFRFDYIVSCFLCCKRGETKPKLYMKQSWTKSALKELEFIFITNLDTPCKWM